VPELAPRILVWREGKLVYKSPDAPSGIRSAGPEQMEVIYIKGQAWRSRSLAEEAARDGAGSGRSLAILYYDQFARLLPAHC
jgi:hypothetical protein